MNIRPPRPVFLALLSAAAGALVLAGGISRASAPAGRYQLGSGTVYDVKTKLTWQQPIATTTYTWGTASTPGTAQSYCAALSTGGGTPWRVPTLRELLTLIDFASAATTLSDGGPGAKVDAVAFPGTPDDMPYWSSTLGSSTVTLAWCLDFSSGYTSAIAPSSPGYVRCVR
jgi:hypothetical protein